MPQIRETKKRKTVNHHLLQNPLFQSSSLWKIKSHQKKKLKVKLSLSKKHTKTLRHAYKVVESNQHIEFAFGNLKLRLNESFTAHNMNCSIKDFFNKYEQIHRKLLIWSHLLKKSLIERILNFIFCTVFGT